MYSSNLIRVHSPSNLTQQESTKSAKAQAVKSRTRGLSPDQVVSEIFGLYACNPAEAKATLDELFKAVDEATTLVSKL